MVAIAWRLVVWGSVCLAMAACGKSANSTSAAPAQEAAVALPIGATASQGNVTATASEFVANNAADPNCPDCQHPDATSHKAAPSTPLDPVFRDDLKLTIGLNAQVLEDGVAILEKNAKEPAAAEAALLAYREKHKVHLAELATKTRDMATRLKALGFEADIPDEVKVEYEARMAKVLARLEVVRAAYAKHPAVLEAFGPFIRAAE
jgi:hypothetical protein